MSFKQALAFGKLGEEAIATWLKHRRDYHILPIYEKQIDEGKGPVLFPANGDMLIAPDLLAFRTVNDVRWIEAKTKTVFSWHRRSQRWVTGIDLHHYTHYLEVAKISPWAIWLLFLHLSDKGGSPCGLFGATLNYLSENENHRSDKWGKSGMVYWAHETLQELATLNEIALATEYNHQEV